MPAAQVFDILRSRLMSVVEQQYRLLNDVMFPQLAAAGVRFLRSEDWTDEQQKWLKDYFRDQVVPVVAVALVRAQIVGEECEQCRGHEQQRKEILELRQKDEPGRAGPVKFDLVHAETLQARACLGTRKTFGRCL